MYPDRQIVVENEWNDGVKFSVRGSYYEVSHWDNCIGDFEASRSGNKNLSVGKWAMDGHHYIGEFQRGYPNGRGTLTSEGNHNSTSFHWQYVGEFLNFRNSPTYCQ